MTIKGVLQLWSNFMRMWIYNRKHRGQRYVIDPNREQYNHTQGW